MYTLDRLSDQDVAWAGSRQHVVLDRIRVGTQTRRLRKSLPCAG